MAETGKRDDPYPQYNFRVEIDGVARAGFTECSGLTTDTDAVDYREGNDVGMHVRKLPGLRTKGFGHASGAEQQSFHGGAV